MSMTNVAAKTYVARIIGGANNQSVLDMAWEAILRAYADWNSAKFWTFLLRDTSLTTSVSGVTATNGSATINAPSSGAFDFVNVGQTVTISGTATLAANTTVQSYTRGSDGTISSITLTNNVGGTTDTAAVLTFSADIPIIAGTSDYNLPNDLNGTYTVRFTDGEKQEVKFVEQRFWDKLTDDQTVSGRVDFYTVYNPVSEAQQAFGHKRLRVFRVPSTSGTLRVRYFRGFNTSGTYIDVPDDFLYKFLDYARHLLLEAKRAQDNPDGYRQSSMDSFEQAQQNDEQPHDDDDGDSRLKSPYETTEYRGPIVGNGAFDPYPL